MIGSAIHTGQVSEVVPVAPRADTRAPLVMERLLPEARSAEMLEEASTLGAICAQLGEPWQRLISADFGPFDAQYIYQRFVGVTLREVFTVLRASGQVLPMGVARAVCETIFEAFTALEGKSLSAERPLHLSDRSIGLAIDRRWRFALGALNHWLADTRPPNVAQVTPLAPDVVFFLSPEAMQGRPETSASIATRAGLFAWQTITGGFHPYRGNPFEFAASLTRYSTNELRVPLDIHPGVTRPFERELRRSILFSGARFDSLASMRATLAPLWPEPAASVETTFQTFISLCWKVLQPQLQSLRREPLLPIRWDGVWDASRTPEEGLAVLEDQLLELHVPTNEFPKRFELPAPGRAEDAADRAQTRQPGVAPRVNLSSTEPPQLTVWSRLLAFFGR